MAATLQPGEARLMRPVNEMLEDLSGDEDDLEGMDEQDQSQPPGTGPYATLHTEGPQVSTGSNGHPDSCMPCTFYCFTRRGCNRGLECRFCHLTHQSKLQQRREAWKKQQREKRKTIRERVAAESMTRRHPSSGKGGSTAELTMGRGALLDGHGGNGAAALSNAVNAKSAVAAYGLPQGGAGACERRPSGGNAAENKAAGGGSGVEVGLAAAAFTYNPPRVTLTIGQEVEMLPQLVAVPVRFRLLHAPLPQGLTLDQTYGAIRGAPLVAAAPKSVVIEAELLGGRTVRAAVEVEVVDFTRGGFVIGHMSEFEPGKFMLLLYVPDEGAGSGGQAAGHDERCALMLDGVTGMGFKTAGSAGGRLVRRPAGMAEQKGFYHGAAGGGAVPDGDRGLGKGRPARPHRSGGRGAGDLEAEAGAGGAGGGAQPQAQQDWW